jgi:hypothetical protein
MRSRLALVVAFVAAAAFAEEPVLLERILAVVNGRPVLLSRVRVMERLKGLDEKAALDAAIDERLMAEEAAQLTQAIVTADEEDRLYRDLVKGGAPDDVTEADLRSLVRREAAILKYVDFRFRSESRVSDADVQKAYDAQYGSTENAPPLAEVRETLRKRLEDAQVGVQVEAWVKELRSAAEIRYTNP